MQTAKINKHTVKFYDSIDELPMSRFHRYNKMLLVDAGVGSDLSDVDAHVDRAMVYLSKGDTANATQELQNLKQAMYFVAQGLSPRNIAFACLVTEIDGKEYSSLSDDSLLEVVETLGDVPISEMTALIEAVKKKIDDELKMYFPKLFNSVESKEYMSLVRERNMHILDAIIGDDDDGEAKAEEIDRNIVTFNKPQVFHGSEGVEVKCDKQYHDTCILMAQELKVNPREYTTQEYFNAYIYLDEYLKSKLKASKYGRR